MEPTLSSSFEASNGVRELTAEEVLQWLQANRFSRAHAALKLEVEDALPGGVVSAPLTEEGASDVTSPVSFSSELANSVTEALTAYRLLAGENSVYALLEGWDPQFLSTCCARRGVGDGGLERSDMEKRMEDLGENCTRLRARERELDTQLRQTVTIIAERLQALVSSVDPMRKDILLPLLRTVAVLGSSSSVRAAARHMVLTLYKRPTVEHRLATVQEWLRIARDAPPRSLEQELIPELYSLVNAPVFERRLLALDCAAAVAPLLRQSPQVRYSLCQGLLRPLCEDEASAVRRELPRCLSVLWGDGAATGAEATGGTGIGQSSSTAAAASTTAPSRTGVAAAISLAPSQQAFVMEMLVHLATDTGSRTVRQAAQTQLCEVLYPVFLREDVLLSHFLPLLLTVIGMEAAQMLLQRKPTARNNAAAAAAAAGEGRRGEADETNAAVASALSLSNVLVLVQLVQAALRCVAAEVVHAREEEGRHHHHQHHHQHGGGRDSTTATAASSLATTYVHVVLPTAHNLLTPLLSRMHCGAPLRGEGDGGDGAGHGQDPATQLCGPLCALCAALASLVPLLGAGAWRTVTQFLKTSVMANTAAASSVALAGSHDTSQSPQELLQGRLLFVFAYLVLLSGDTGALADRADLVANTDAAASASSPTAQPALPSGKRLQQEGLSFLSQQIRLNSDNLTSPRSTAMTTCVHCIASLAPFALESHEVSSGFTALVRFLVAASDPRLRLTAVVLVHDACAAIANERLKVALFMEPLQLLLEDLQPAVQEAALTGILSAAVALTEPRTQEKAIRPVLRVADMAGCTSRFTCCMLMQWDQLMQRMPAEPREALLYPQLAALMDRLAEQYVERVSRVGMVPPPPPPPPPAAAVAVAVAVAAGVPGGPPGTSAPPPPPSKMNLANPEDGSVLSVSSCELQDRSVEQWEGTMLILQALLHNILRCAVVTPTLVGRYLLPGIQQLASDGILLACSANVRTRWQRLLKNYLLFSESNAGRYSSFAAHPSAGNLLDRVKDELKRRL